MVDGLSLFIPVYNEEAVIEDTINETLMCLEGLGLDYELFLVDDGSGDSSGRICLKASDLNPRVRCVGFEDGHSYRENLAQSFSLAGFGIVHFMDADLSTDLKHLGEAVSYMREGYDIAVGSRHVEGASVKRGLRRLLVSNLFKHFVRLLFGSSIHDHECGFKTFRRDKLVKLVGLMGFDEERKRKMFWDTELLVRAQKMGLKIKEYPVDWREGGKTSISIVKHLPVLLYALKLRYRL